MNSNILQEMRSLANSNGPVDEQVFRRLILASMADMNETLQDHRHEALEQQVKALAKRDLLALGLIGLTALGSIVAAVVR